MAFYLDLSCLYYTQTMILYLIRHGKTDAHLKNRRQSPGTPLGDFGRRQAKAVAKRLHLLKIDHLYSSDWPRAYQTAEIISKKSKLPIKVHPHVHEMKKSPLLDDLPDESETAKRYYAEMKASEGNFDWKFNNEGESLNELIDRAKSVIKFLVKEHVDDTVAIVTHGTFTMVLVSVILLGPDYDKKSFLNLLKSIHIHNTGITSFDYDSEKKRWYLNCLNDHGHLENESCS